MKKFEDRQVRVFISSTFRGMGEEREVLARHVFPEIHRRCSERGIGFTEVDLRWGIAIEEIDKGLPAPICFQQIDNCLPFFIGLLGEYYGGAILPEQIKTTCADYPWIKKGYLNRSITELEILYALLEPKRTLKQRNAIAKQALFYFRDPNYAETLPENERQPYIEPSAANRARQQKLKQRLHAAGRYHINDYKQPIDLKELVLEQLWEKISHSKIGRSRTKFPDTPQQRADFEHEAFAASRQKVYIKRQTDFDRLNQHAHSNAPPLIITGESGSGKTALLANWAAEYRENHADELVFWHFCGSSPESTDPIALLQRIMLNLKSHFKIAEEIPGTAIKKEFWEWLAKAPARVILIIDGLNQLEETPNTQGWLHSIPTKTRLFLSTISADDERLSADWQKLNLPLLTEKSAREDLITEYLKGKTLTAKPMQALLEHPKTANPLYLQIILEELRIFSDFDKLEKHLQSYLQTKTIPALHEKVLARLDADYQPKCFPHLVEDALSLLWAARQGLEESELLAILEIPQAIWSPLYFALQNTLVSRAGLLSFFHDYLRQAVEHRYLPSPEQQQRWHLRLADYFDKQTVKERNDSRVANELPWQLEQAGEKERLRDCISQIPMFLQFEGEKLYEMWGYWLGLAPENTMVGAYHESLAKYEKTEKPKENDLAYLLNQLAGLFRIAGYFSAAIPLLRRALAIKEKILGKQHPDTAISLNNLAGLLESKGDYSKAEPLYKRALAIRKKVLGKEHPLTAQSMNNLAALHYAKGDYDSPEPLYKRALFIYEKLLGKEHPLTALSMNNLASLHQAKGDYVSAEPLYKRALSIYEKLLGKEHPDTALSMNNLAALHQAKGDYDSAEPLYKRALAIRKKILGKEHLDTAGSLNNLAGLHQAKGDYDSAEPLYKRALAIREKVLGKQHPLTAQSMNNLAGLHQAKGDYVSAEPLYKRALSIYEKVLGKEHPDIATTLSSLAALLESKGDYSKAEPLYRRALAIREKILGKEHPDTALSMNNLAYLHYAKGESDKAEPLFKRALSIREKVLDKEHPDTATSLNNLAYLLYAKGDYDSPEPLYKRALAIREKVLGKEHPETVNSLNNLASLLESKGDYDSAEPLYIRALAIREKVLGKEHPDTAQSMSNLAGLLYSKGDFGAEPLYSRALAISENVFGAEHPNTAQSLTNLAKVLIEIGEYDSAEPLYKRALSIYEKVLGKEHPDTAQSMTNLAALFQAKGEYVSAEPLYKRALAIRKKVLGKRHPDTATSLNHLAALYYAKGKIHEAKPLIKRALKIFEKVLGAEHPNTLITRNNLAGCRANMG